MFPPTRPATKPPLLVVAVVPGLHRPRLCLAAPRIRAGRGRLGHPPPTHRQPSHDRQGLPANGGDPAPCPGAGGRRRRQAVQAFQRLLGAARRARLVQHDHPDHVGCRGVAMLHGAAEVPERAGFSPPVAEQLLADEKLTFSTRYRCNSLLEFVLQTLPVRGCRMPQGCRSPRTAEARTGTSSCPTSAASTLSERPCTARPSSPPSHRGTAYTFTCSHACAPTQD